MDRSKWEHLIPEVRSHTESGRIVSVLATADGRIEVTKRLGHYTTVATLSSDVPYCFALKEVVGPLEPGVRRDFITVESTEYAFTVEALEELLTETEDV